MWFGNIETKRGCFTSEPKDTKEDTFQWIINYWNYYDDLEEEDETFAKTIEDIEKFRIEEEILFKFFISKIK